MSRPSEAALGRSHKRGSGGASVSQLVDPGAHPSTVLRFALPSSTPAAVTVTTLDGRLVRTLRQSVLPAGEHLCAWDGRDDRGQRVAAGVYTIQLEAAGRTLTSRVVQLG